MTSTSNMHVVRINSCGSVGHYVSDDQQTYERGTRVVCRTQRGLEVGEVLASVPGEKDLEAADGDLVRGLDHQDETDLARLAHQRDHAIQVCQSLLDRAAIPAAIVDAVVPLDGQHICFYVLGPLDSSMNAVARQIGTHFGVNVQFLPVASTAAGDCGSGGCAARGGCATQGCASCPVADACGK